MTSSKGRERTASNTTWTIIKKTRWVNFPTDLKISDQSRSIIIEQLRKYSKAWIALAEL